MFIESQSPANSHRRIYSFSRHLPILNSLSSSQSQHTLTFHLISVLDRPPLHVSPPWAVVAPPRSALDPDTLGSVPRHRGLRPAPTLPSCGDGHPSRSGCWPTPCQPAPSPGPRSLGRPVYLFGSLTGPTTLPQCWLLNQNTNEFTRACKKYCSFVDSTGSRSNRYSDTVNPIVLNEV